jgi:hypothetical protein
MSGSSIVPSTLECEARICSSSVEPARGRPTMKIGSGRSQPQPRRAAKNSAVQTSFCKRVLRSIGAILKRLSAFFSALPRS